MTDETDENVGRPHDETVEADEPVRVALGFGGKRNRELLAGLLDGYEVITAETAVPPDADVCVVDADGFRRLRDSLREWKRDEQPAVAPALLVAGDDESELWSRYADEMGTALDAVQSIPAPKRAIRSRVDGLVALRRHSTQAAERGEQLRLYGRAMDDAGVGITIADATADDLPLVYVNDQFCRITGYDRETVIGRNCRFLQGPETEPEKREQFREAFAAERPVTVELRNYRKDGEMFWNEVNVVPVYGEGETITHYIGFQTDVTERKRRETQLEEYEHLVQSVNDPILALEADDTVAYANEAGKRVFCGSASKTAFPDLFAAEQAATVRDALESVRESRTEVTRELSVPGGVGGPATYQFRFQLGTFAERERLVVVARDITDIRRHQDRLSVLDRVLRHDLRNKLNVVSGRAKMLVDDPDCSPETVASAAESIDAAAESLLDIADAVRNFDVAPGETTAVERDVVAVVREALQRFDERHPELVVTADLPETAPARCPTQLRFCLDQLVENAIDRATDVPRVTFAVTSDDASVTLRVHDEGDPLPPVERRALAAGVETQLEHTQGVGIWLVRWAVEGVGGNFRIEETGTGTTVALTLPR